MGDRKIFHYDPTEAGRLHCDACSYDMPNKVAFTPSLIGMQCPECGADMLTLSDYLKTASLFRKLDWINKWFGPLFGRDANSSGGTSMQMKIHDDEVVIRKVGDL